MKGDKLIIEILGGIEGSFSIKGSISGNPIVMHGMIIRAKRELARLYDAARDFENKESNENAKKEADKLKIGKTS